jgi:hypothetical protein
MAFYERGFSIPPHRFLCSLLWHFDLELHHLTPFGVLHIAAFVTLCEGYLGIDPELDLWKYFFHVWRLQDPEAELTISGGAVIHVKAGHGVDPYLKIPMPRSMNGWRKKWFYLKNDAPSPLPVFTDGCPIPLPSWGEGVASKDLGMLQPFRENLQQLWQDGLTRVHLLQTFFIHWIQPLCWRRTKMWPYPCPNCPSHPSFKELSAVEVDAQICKVLYLGVIPTPGVDPVPLRRGISSVKVSTSSPVLVSFTILSLHCAHDLA